MNSTHRANVVRIEALLPHTNADNLELVHIGGYQCVVRKGSFKVGDLAVYVQPDSVVPQTEPFKFIWEGHAGLDGTVPERRRRITVKKLRKEYSEGLLMPISDFSGGLVHEPKMNYGWLKEGDDVAELLGITHYEPVEVGQMKGESGAAPKRRYPRTLKGWFFWGLHKLGVGVRPSSMEVSFDVPIYDVDAYKNFQGAFEPGELVVVTEKVHGSNARYMYLDGTMYAGSHRQWKHEKSGCVFRKVLEQQPWIEEWCRAHEGSTLYGEVVPTQKDFNYGCTGDQKKFLAFDIRHEDGTWAKPWILQVENAGGQSTTYCTTLGEQIQAVPLIGAGPFDKEMVTKWVDGQSKVEGANHIREGVVINSVEPRYVRGLGRLQLKVVSNAYLEKQ